MSKTKDSVEGHLTDEDGPVSDEALSDALAALENDSPAEEVVETAEEDTPETETQPEPEPPPAPSFVATPTVDPDADPGERSRLGRKVKSLEMELAQMREQLVAKNRPPPVAGEADEEMPEFITTPDELEKYLEIREKRKNRSVDTYRNGYSQKFLVLGQEDPMYDEIEQEMMTNFNVKTTGNPQIDAEINYSKAKAAVAMKKIGTAPAQPAARVIPGMGNKPQGSGVTVTARNVRTASAPVQLDAFAADFVRRTGMSDDTVRGVFAGGSGKPRR